MNYYQMKMLFLFLVLALVSCRSGKVENKYPNGKIMETYSVNKNAEKNGDYVMYFESGKIKEKAEYKNGKLIGKRTLFFENGNPEMEELYTDDGLLNGLHRTFYPEGPLMIEKTYTNNVISGQLKVYYPSGKIKEEVTMNGNQENGPFTEYFENGQIQWKGTYLNGDNEFGLLEEFDSLGAPIKKMKCDSLAICRTFWRPGMPDVKLDSIGL